MVFNLQLVEQFVTHTTRRNQFPKMPLPEAGPAVEENDTDYFSEVVVLTEGILSSVLTVSTDLAKCLDASLVSTLERTRL